MTVRRNDPCPCGSGKKYKQCCLKKNNVIAFQELKEQRFFETKHALTDKIKNFVYKKLNPANEKSLRNEFKGKLQGIVESDDADKYYLFWLLHLYRFENGKRGIEWYGEEKQNTLSIDERELLANWLPLYPRLLQVVMPREKGIEVEDLITHERFYMPYCETLSHGLPWAVCLAMLEPYEDGYVMHGVSAFTVPSSTARVVAKIQEELARTHQAYEHVMTEQYMDLLALLLQNSAKPKSEKVELVETTLVYDAPDLQQTLSFLFSHDAILASEKEGETYSFSLVGSWHRYEDSLMQGAIYITPSFASLTLKNGTLEVVITDEKYIQMAKEVLESPSAGLQYRATNVKTHEVPASMEYQTYCVFATVQEGHTPLFGAFAQGQLMRQESLDKPLEIFKGKSIRELMKEGRSDEVEEWLENAEFNSFMLHARNLGTYDLAYTEDFNSLRQSLGLPLSPFVKGGDTRHTSLVSCGNPFKKNEQKDTENEPQAEEKATQQPSIEARTEEEAELPLGLTAETSQAFYADDLLAFYREKTDGKSATTLKKYEKSLGTLVEYFATAGENAERWTDCTEAFWKRLVGHVESESSVTQLKAFISTITAFAKWLDKKLDTDLHAFVKEAADTLKVK